MVTRNVKRSARELLAENIMFCRAKNGLSQEDIVSLSQYVCKYIDSIERLERNISFNNIEWLAVTLEIQLKAAAR